jgi:uncharacterized protein YprB with RNaseH-like and TPR domain
MPSLSDRLKSLGVKIGAQDLPPPRPASLVSLDRILQGHVYETPLGETYVVESRYSNGYTQGSTPLTLQFPLDAIAAWGGNERIRTLSPHQIAYLDTETTGLSGGTGTYAFLIGIGRIIGEEFHLAQFFLRDPLEEPGQLAALEAFLAPCAAVVTFNGKTFDIPLLVTRYMTHEWRSPFRELIHIDLLHLARRLWSARLPSRTLTNLEYNILGVLRTEEDVPGWMIPQLYFDYLRTGDATRLRSVFYHNAMDVISLAALLNHISGLFFNPRDNAQHAEDIISMARIYEDLGDMEISIQLYEQGLASGLPIDLQLDALYHLALIHKRLDNFIAAKPLWEQAALLMHLPSHIELAKYLEHRQQDYLEAIQWIEHALSAIESEDLSQYERVTWLNELNHRLNRLHRKLHGSSGL